MIAELNSFTGRFQPPRRKRETGVTSSGRVLIKAPGSSGSGRAEMKGQGFELNVPPWKNSSVLHNLCIVLF